MAVNYTIAGKTYGNSIIFYFMRVNDVNEIKQIIHNCKTEYSSLEDKGND